MAKVNWRDQIKYDYLAPFVIHSGDIFVALIGERAVGYFMATVSTIPNRPMYARNMQMTDYCTLINLATGKPVYLDIYPYETDVHSLLGFLGNNLDLKGEPMLTGVMQFTSDDYDLTITTKRKGLKYE